MQYNEFVFMLNISADQYLRYYQGAAKYIVARSHDGQTIRFPAAMLRRFVTREGVHGEFRLRYDRNYRMVSLDRLTERSDRNA